MGCLFSRCRCSEQGRQSRRRRSSYPEARPSPFSQHRESQDVLVSPREQMRQWRANVPPPPPPRPARPDSADSPGNPWGGSSSSYAALPPPNTPRPRAQQPSQMLTPSSNRTPGPRVPLQTPPRDALPRQHDRSRYDQPDGRYQSQVNHHARRQQPQVSYQPQVNYQPQVPQIRPNPLPHPAPSSQRPPAPLSRRPLPPPPFTLPNTTYHPFPLLRLIMPHLSHTHTALSGPEALTIWGHPSAPPLILDPLSQFITLLCPSSDTSIIRCWACVAGWDVRRSGQHPNGDHDEIGLLSSREGDYGYRWDYTVRVKGLPREVWDDEIDTEVLHGVRVLGLVDLLDEFAGHWVAFSGVQREGEMAEAVVWILEKMLGQERAPQLRGWRVPHVVDERFWVPFLAKYPVSGPLFELCGLGV